MSLFKGISFLLVLAVACACPAATALYVACDGSGDYNCEGSADDVEINQALTQAAAAPGTTVYLKAGTYTISSPLRIGSYTTLTGDRAAKVMLTAGAGWANRTALIGPCSQGAHDITISGFEIDGNIENQGLAEGVRYGSGWYSLMTFPDLNYNITVSSMYLHNGGNDGLMVEYHPSIWSADDPGNVVFRDNIVYKIGHDACYAIGISTVQAFNNDVYTRTNSAFRLQNSNHGSIHDNIIHSDYSGSSTGPGIELQRTDSQQVMDDIEICNNVFHTLNGAAIWMHGLDSDGICRGRNVHIHHNIIYDTGQYWWYNGYSNGAIVVGYFDNTVIENNVISNGGHAAVMNQLKGPSDTHAEECQNTYASPVTTIVRNNIIVNNTVVNGNDGTYDASGILNTGQPYAHYAVSYNCFYNNTADSSGTGIVLSDTISSDPLFADAAGHDYHLKSAYGRWTGSAWVTDSVTSPCIDAGDPSSAYAGEPPYNGGRIKIGRYGNTAEASRSCAAVAAVAAPAFSPAGGSYTSAPAVTLRTTTGGATIYYTMDGSEPSASSLRYSSPVTVSSSLTLKALAVKAGMADSPVTSAVYIVDVPGLVNGEVKIVGSAATRGIVNPDRGETVKIFFKGTGPGRCGLRIFTLTGQLVLEDARENSNEGSFVWSPGNAASGVYIADIKGPGIAARKKIAILK